MCSNHSYARSILTIALILTIPVSGQGQVKPPGVVQIVPQKKNPIIPGAVQLKNGMLLYGLCDNANTIDPDLPQSRRLELRRINQQFRTYFVATRRSNAAQQNELALPKDDFRIPQRRTSQQPLNYELGLHAREPFDASGQSKINLRFRDNKVVSIKLGITAINSGRVQVDGLTHQWQFGVSMDAVPESTLYAGLQAPSLLKRVKNYDNADAQLRLAEMLIQAGKFTAAMQLLNNIQSTFPATKNQCDRLIDLWNKRVSERALEELNLLRDTGKYETARAYAHQWPEQNLAAYVRVMAKKFLQELDEDAQRLMLTQQALNALVAEIEDETLRTQSKQMMRDIDRELDLNTLDRFKTFDFFRLDTTLAPEAKLALAGTGLIMGPDNAIDNFAEAIGIFQIRAILRDYLSTLDDEKATRDQLLGEIRQQEGFSVKRVGLLLQHLPPTLPISIGDAASNAPGEFKVDATEDAAPCIGKVPREYATTRRYPIIIAFPREGMSPDETLKWWQKTADRNGYIVVVPSIYDEKTFSYDASATQHSQTLNLIRTLKSGLSIDDDRVFVAGHGIGGEVAMDIATAHPDLFAGVAPISSLGRRHLSLTAHNSADLAWYIVAGSRHRNWIGRLKPLIEKLFRRHDVRGRLQYSDVVFARYDHRGFESYAEELPNLFRWLEFQKRSKLPDRIEARILRSTDTSWFWLTLADLPQRIRVLDEPNEWNDVVSAKGQVKADINGSANLIRLLALPADVTLRLSPGLPDLDLTQPITIINVNQRRQKVDYVPSTRDLLSDFRDRRDRKQLCFMKVSVRR